MNIATPMLIKNVEIKYANKSGLIAIAKPKRNIPMPPINILTRIFGLDFCTTSGLPNEK